jgi:hypothetical protein
MQHKRRRILRVLARHDVHCSPGELYGELGLAPRTGSRPARAGFGVVRNPEYPPAGGGSRRSAREILDERLARGEIDSGEYDRLREKLEQAGTPQNPTPT